MLIVVCLSVCLEEKNEFVCCSSVSSDSSQPLPLGYAALSRLFVVSLILVMLLVLLLLLGGQALFFDTDDRHGKLVSSECAEWEAARRVCLLCIPCY